MQGMVERLAAHGKKGEAHSGGSELRGIAAAKAVAKLFASRQHARSQLEIGADAKLDPVQVATMTMVTATVMNTPDAYSLR